MNPLGDRTQIPPSGRNDNTLAYSESPAKYLSVVCKLVRGSGGYVTNNLYNSRCYYLVL